MLNKLLNKSTLPPLFALDFGTTNSLLAAAAPGLTFEPVPLDVLAPDPTILRTALHFTTAEDVVFGQEALRRYIGSGLRGRLLRSIKRHLSSPSFDSTRIGTKLVNIEDITAAFLRAMRQRACKVFDTEINRVLLGRPARFSDIAREDALAEARLGRAARLAGFREIWFCYEPVAAAYDFAGHFDQPRTVLIGIKPEDIESACLTGGTSLVPIFESALRSTLKGAQVVRLRNHHSVVQGLARCARALEEGTGAAGVVKHAETSAINSAPPSMIPVGRKKWYRRQKDGAAL